MIIPFFGLKLGPMKKENERSKTIKRATEMGIALNLILGSGKIAVGIITQSLSFLSDGVNNLSDSLSSFVTMLAYKASKRRPTKAHPMGYGRIEYLSALFVSFAVLLTGFSFLKSGIKSFGKEEIVILTPILLVLLSLTVLVKVALFFYFRWQGNKSSSLALKAAAKDSLSDALVSSMTIISALFSPLLGINLDSPSSIIVSLFIIWTGFESILETSDTILGKRPTKEEVEKIRAIIKEYPPLCGGYDIRIHSYGPEYSMGTIDVEVPFTSTAEEVYEAMEKAKKRLKDEMGIIFTFGMNAENQDDERVKKMMEKTIKCIKLSYDSVIGIHGFHVHFGEKRIEFDVVVDFSLKDWESFRKNLTGLLELVFPDYTVSFNIDPDYS